MIVRQKKIAFYEKIHMTSASEKEEELISQGSGLESDEINTFNFNPSRDYIQGEIKTAIGLNSPSATFNHTATYNKGTGSVKVYSYKGSQWEASHALKKIILRKVWL